VVKREEFAQMVEETADLPSLCSALIDLANERGGPDNVTVVAARFEGDGLPGPDSADGAGYEVYHVPEEEISEPPPVREHSPPAPPPPAAASIQPGPASRPSGLLIVAALVALIALILTALL
jgi:protein phosphatase